MADVTVLGLGRMGAAMAVKLVEAGHSVTVWNRSRAAVDQLAAACPVIPADSAAAAVSGSSIVITMMADAAATAEVLLGAPSAAAAMAPGTIVCDMCTGGVQAARALDAALTLLDLRFVDAPVSGSVPTIQSGQLLVMASGDESGILELQSVLSAFAKRVASLGPAGAGQSMKLAVNLVVFALNAAVSEALALADASGISLADAYDVFQDSVVAAPFVAYKRPAFLDPSVPVAMSLDLVLKDMRLITGEADALGASLMTSDAVRDQVAAACAAGFGASDMSALGRFLRDEEAQ